MIGWHLVMMVDAFFVNLFAFYASRAVAEGNIGGAIVWCGLTLWLSYCLVRDING